MELTTIGKITTSNLLVSGIITTQKGARELLKIIMLRAFTPTGIIYYVTTHVALLITVLAEGADLT